MHYAQHHIKDTTSIDLFGNWIIKEVRSLSLPTLTSLPKLTQNIVLNFKDVKSIDTSGGLLIIDWVERIQESGKLIEFQDLSNKQEKLLSDIKKQYSKRLSFNKKRKDESYLFLSMLGKETSIIIRHFVGCIDFVGRVFFNIVRLISFNLKLPWKNICSVIDIAGVKALPIVTVLAFLIGVVLAHQLGGTLKQFGANIYIADLLVISVFREFAPLITAIIIAGRTGCYFAAQIGTMNVNNELDALDVMGVSIFQRVILPKIIGLLIVLPLLTIWFSLWSIFGGMFMSAWTLDVSYTVFIDQIKTSALLDDFVLGQVKTPFYALAIAIIGCYEGLTAKKSAASVGIKTTKSVVNAIFLIIVSDAVFSVVYRYFGV